MLESVIYQLEKLNDHMTIVCDSHKLCIDCPLRDKDGECSHHRVLNSLILIRKGGNK